jgi:flavin-dependent dehydrogenase
MMEIGSQYRHFSLSISIIGSGPSGLATAIWCAKFGLQVTVLESEKTSGSRPGETLHPGIEPLFDQLGVGEPIRTSNFLRHAGTWVKWNGDHLNFVPFGEDKHGPWLGYQILRTELQRILLNQALKLGVIVLRSCKAIDIIYKFNRVIGVRTSLGDFESKFLVDAGGGAHWLARRLNLSIEKYSPPLFVLYGYVKQNLSQQQCREPFLIATDEGWMWIAKIKNNLYQWTRLFFEKQNIIYDKNMIIKNYSERLPRIHGADVTWRTLIEPAGSGYFIVGDAAAVLDPASSHGVLRGLMSGIKAAHAIIKMTKDQVPNWIASRNYNKWLNEWFVHDVGELKKFYSQHRSPPNWL